MNMRSVLSAVLLLALACTSASAQSYDEVQIKTTKMTDRSYMLEGAGGNIGVFVTDDGVFMIDCQMGALHDKIKAAIAEISDKPVKYLFNTHWHHDHTDGNALFAEEGAEIIAHANVGPMLAADQEIPFFKSNLKALPISAQAKRTFTDSMSLTIGNMTMNIVHPGVSHTDGDAIVFFPDENVVHMGDVFFNNTYPFIDVTHKGSIDGMITAVELALPRLNKTTKVVPGHGPLANKARLEEYLKMLIGVRDNVAALVKDGKSFDEVVAAAPTAEFDASWSGFINAEGFLSLVYEDLSSR